VVLACTSTPGPTPGDGAAADVALDRADTPGDRAEVSADLPLDVPPLDAPLKAPDVPLIDAPLIDAPDDVSVDVMDAPSMSACGVTLTGTLSAGAPVMGMLPSGAGRFASAGCQVDASGAEHVYLLRVGSPVIVSLGMSSAFRGVLAVRRRCEDASAGSELACGFASALPPMLPIMPQSATRAQARFETGDYFVVVDAVGTEGGAYTLNATFTAPIPNGSCVTAAPLTPGVTVTGAPPSGALPTPHCGSMTAAAWYSMVIPPMQRGTLTATNTTSTTTPALVSLSTSSACGGPCGDTIALLPALLGRPQAVTTTHDNPTGAPRTVLLAASGSGLVAGVPVVATYQLGYTLGPMPPRSSNAVCDATNPMLVPGAARVVDLGTGGVATSTTDERCVPGAAGPSLFYRAEVPARSGVWVSAQTPTMGGINVFARALRACRDAQCYAASDISAGSSSRGITLANTSDAARTFAVEVGAVRAGASGSVTVSASALPQVYTVARIPNACADVSGGASLPDADGVEGVTTYDALPFPFRTARDPSAPVRVSVASNGYLLLTTSVTGRPGSLRMNETLPSVRRGVVAPFWDDLTPSSTPGVVASTRSAVVGAPGSQRFVVEWAGRGLATETPGGPDDSSADLRFQAHLVEGTNEIEFHYCAMTANRASVARVRGASATIGVGNIQQLAGATYSFDEAVPDLVAMGVRFTPLP